MKQPAAILVLIIFLTACDMSNSDNQRAMNAWGALLSAGATPQPGTGMLGTKDTQAPMPRQRRQTLTTFNNRR